MAWLEDYTYRKSITLSRASGAVTLYQMKLLVGESAGAVGEDVDCNSHVLSTFNDLRFTTSDGQTPLDYWIESITGTTPNRLATVWIEFDSIETGATTFYMYYGKADATAVSNGTNTFMIFDDFERGVNGDGVGGGWTTTTAKISTDHPYGGSRCAKLPGGAGGCYMYRALAAASQSYSIRARVWKEDLTSDPYLYYHGNGSAFTLVAIRALGGENIHYSRYPSGWLDAGSDIVADAWNLLEINDIIFASKTFDVWFAESKIVDNGTIATGVDQTNNLSFGNNDTTVGRDLYLDDIIVRNWRPVGPAWGSWGSEEGGGITYEEETLVVLSSVCSSEDYFNPYEERSLAIGSICFTEELWYQIEEPTVVCATSGFTEDVQSYRCEEVITIVGVVDSTNGFIITETIAEVVALVFAEDIGFNEEIGCVIVICNVEGVDLCEEGLVVVSSQVFQETQCFEEVSLTAVSDIKEEEYFVNEESLTIEASVAEEDYFYEEWRVDIVCVVSETDLSVSKEVGSFSIVATIAEEDGIVPAQDQPVVYIISECYEEDLWHQMDLTTVVNTSVVMGEDSANFKEEQQYIAIAIIKSTLSDAFAPAIKGRGPRSGETAVGLSRKVSFYVCGTMGDGVDIDEVKVKINGALYEKGDPEFSYGGSASQHYVEVDHPMWGYMQGVDVEIDAKSLNGVSMSKVSYSFTTEWNDSLTVGGDANIELYEANNYSFDILTLEEDWVRQGVERYTPELEAWWGRYQKLPFIENLQLRVRAGATNARGKEILDNGWLSVKIDNGSFVQMYSDTMIDLGPMFTHTKRSIFFKLMVPETAASKKYFVLELEFEPQMYFPYGRFRYSKGTYANGGNMIKLTPNQHVYRAYVFDQDMWQDIIDLGIISSPFYRGEDKKW